MKKLITFITILCGVSANALDLKTALEQAYDYNPTLKAQREDLKKTDEQVMQAISGFLPTITAQRQKQINNVKNYPRQTLSGYQNATDYDSSSASSSLSIKQDVFNGGRDIANVATAKNIVQAARYEMSKAEQDVLLNVVKAYLSVVQAQDTLEIQENKVASYRTLVYSTKEKFKAGELTKTDVSRSEAQYSKSISDRISAEGNLRSAKAAFYSLVGVEAENLKMPHLEVVLPSNVDDAVSVAFQKNPTINISKHNKAATDAKVMATRSNLLPSASLQFSRSKANAALVSGSTYNNTTTMGITVPIFSGGRNWSSLRAAKREAASRGFAVRAANNSVYESTVRAWQNFQIAKASMNARNDAVDYAKQAWEGMKIEEQAGTRDITDVILAQNEFFDSKISLLSEQVNYLANFYALKSQIGEMTAKELKLDVNLYDPMDNYNKITKQLIGSF